MTLPKQDSYFSELRHRMVESQLRSRGIADELVLAAMSRVPREQFTPEKYRDHAYEDHPLPIGAGQTISQPYMVALMLEALAIRPEDRVLEVGTGSGYVTAILTEMAGEVISVERHTSLASEARELLNRLGYDRAMVFARDGSQGVAEFAPYDVILVSAASDVLPRALVAELAEGGRMIVPVGFDDSQQLQLIRMRNGQPGIQMRELCRFVPLLSGSE